MSSWTRAILTAATALLLVAPVAAQVVREGDVSSVAGVLGGLEAKAYDDFAFTSGGGEVLFATVDLWIYQTMGATHEEHLLEAAAEGEEGGGCGEDEGGVGTCLQVLDEIDQVVCWATRPRMPGWQRDPRLVCVLPEVHGQPAAYRLRMALADEDCSDLVYPVPEAGDDVPYLLNVSLRRVAPSGPLAPAIAISKNRF